jgi:hypothetical protein
MTNFGRITNLRALLASRNFPESFEPYIRHIRALYDPVAFTPQNKTYQRQSLLDQDVLNQLVGRLNGLFPLEGGKWVTSDRFSNSTSTICAPVNSFVQIFPSIKHGDGIFSDMKTNDENCVIELKPNLQAKYGMIKSIFTHSRRPPGAPGTVTDTWLVIHPLTPVPATHNPFNQLKQYDAIGTSLRRLEDSQVHVVHLEEIEASCAWIKYKAGELSAEMPFDTIGLVSLSR